MEANEYGRDSRNNMICTYRLVVTAVITGVDLLRFMHENLPLSITVRA